MRPTMLTTAAAAAGADVVALSINLYIKTGVSIQTLNNATMH